MGPQELDKVLVLDQNAPLEDLKVRLGLAEAADFVDEKVAQPLDCFEAEALDFNADVLRA
jgi:hypothetical protein